MKVRAMEVSTTNPVLDRLLGVAGLRKDSELARLLGISPQAVSKVRKSGKTPASWISFISEKFHIPKQDITPNSNNAEVEKNNTYPKKLEVDSLELKLLSEKYVKLKAELEKEREERWELAQENRELAQENRKLWRENGELREKCAVLEERQKTCCPEENPLFRKKPEGGGSPCSAQVYA